MGQMELLAKVKEFKKLKAMAQELASVISDLEDDIKAEMSARDAERLIIGPFTVSWTSYVSHRFDSTAFKATHAELYSQYLKASSARRFSVA